MKYAISEYKHNPPRRVSWLDEVDSKELIYDIAQRTNTMHRLAKTGKVFKVYTISNKKEK